MSELLQIVRQIDPFLLNALSFLVGLLAGHRIQLTRDKRREYNDAIEMHRREILTQGTRARLPDAADLDRIERHLWPWERRRLRTAIERAEQCRAANEYRATTFGNTYFQNPAAVKAAMHDVLRSMRPR